MDDPFSVPICEAQPHIETRCPMLNNTHTAGLMTEKGSKDHIQPSSNFLDRLAVEDAHCQGYFSSLPTGVKSDHFGRQSGHLFVCSRTL